MIHFAIGSKAQLIKTAPVMRRLTQRGVPYRYIDLGQHARTTARLRPVLQLQEPDVRLHASTAGNVASLVHAGRWVGSILLRSLRSGREIFNQVFDRRPGICVIHGDAFSALLGLLLAKRAGLKVCHLESGLVSRQLREPFPEELVRLLCMRHADHLAAPTEWAYRNLLAMGYGPKSFSTGGNTGADAVADLLMDRPPPAAADPFVLVAIHRFETLVSRTRLGTLVSFIEDLAARMQIHFVLHEPTERRLRQRGWLTRLHEKGVRLTPGADYPDFLTLLRTAAFVVADGGSVQEECSYLGTPCLVFRRRTERVEGLGENVCLSRLDPARLAAFARDYARFRRPPSILERRPSDIVADFLVRTGSTAAATSGEQ